MLCLALFAGAGAAFALTPDQAVRIAAGESDARLAALNEVVLAVDPALGPYLQAMLADEVKVAGGKAYIVRDGKAIDAATGADGDAARGRRGRGQQQPHAPRARGARWRR